MIPLKSCQMPDTSVTDGMKERVHVAGGFDRVKFVRVEYQAEDQTCAARTDH
jgi:hypothetical protein